jgi:hypothetical protein
MVMRGFCCLLAVTLACATACRAEEASGATLVRKCETYLYGARGRLPSGQAAQDAAYCAGFIDATIAAARLAHEQGGVLPPDGQPPGSVDAKAYRAFVTSLRLGVDTCLPQSLATRDVARQFRLMMSLNRELRWADELTALQFVLAVLYPCKGASP